MTISNYIKERESYEIFIVETGEVIEKCRLKAGATNRLPELRKITKEEIDIRKVK